MTGFHCCLVEHEAPEPRQSTYFGSGNSTATDLTDIEQFQINPIDIPPVGLQATAPFPIILKASLQSLHLGTSLRAQFFLNVLVKLIHCFSQRETQKSHFKVGCALSVSFRMP
jgi:hypothetical protein